MPQQTLEMLKKFQALELDNKYRKGNTVHLPNNATVLVAGDLHGNRRNFDRLVKVADLENNPDHHLVLQEIIHGGPEDEQGGCLSFQLLLDAVALKIKFHERVHMIMGNHDTAFISHSEVMKSGKEMNDSMRNALKRNFKEHADDIDLEIARVLFAQPLAVRCPNGIMISHSLPAGRFVDQFDSEILNKKLKVNDIVRPGSAYLWTWGRHQKKEVIEKFAKMLNVKIFIVGHQPQEQGFDSSQEGIIIIASDHSHGVFMKFNCNTKYSQQQLAETIVPLASIV